MGKILVEIQHFHDCPNGPQMIANVKSAILGLDEVVDYKETLVEDSELAARLNFRGSPTLLINGDDFDGMAAPEQPGLNCRLYSNGLPKAKAIKQHILEIYHQTNRDS